MHEKVFSCWQESAMHCVARAALGSSDLLSFSKDSPVLISKSAACYFKMSFTISTFWIFLFWIFSVDLIAKKWPFALCFCHAGLIKLLLKDASGFEQKISWWTGTSNCADLSFLTAKPGLYQKKFIYISPSLTWQILTCQSRNHLSMFCNNCTIFLCIIGFILLGCYCWRISWKVKPTQRWSVALKQS